MKRFAAIFILSAAFAAHATNDLEVARAALDDGLWRIAESHAKLAQNDPVSRDDARTAELEALAGQGRFLEIPLRIDSWLDARGERFRYWRAWAEFSAGHVAEARRLLAEKFTEDEYAVRALRLSARVAALEGKLPDAVDRFSKAQTMAKGRDAIANAVEWARVVWNEDGGKASLKVLLSSKAVDGEGPWGDAARMLAARLFKRLGDNEGAVKLLRRLCDGGMKTEESAFVEAACALAEAGVEDAKAILSNAVVRAERRDLVCRAGFAYGFIRLGDEKGAQAAVDSILSLVNRFPDEAESKLALKRLADELLQLKDANGALRVLDMLPRTYPEFSHDVHVVEGRGWAFEALGRHSEAEGAFARAAAMASNAVDRARCTLKRADVLLASGRSADAAAVYAEVKDKSFIQRARFGRADALLRSGEKANALTLYREISGEGGELAVESGLRAASIASTLGRYEEAVDIYTGILNTGKEPSDEQARVRSLEGRGRSYYNSFRYREARADFDEVAKLRPARAAEMKFFNALCSFGEGRGDEAEAAVRTLLGETGDTPFRNDLSMWLAQYCALKRENKTAMAIFETCSTNRFAPPGRRIEALVRAARCASASADYQAVLDFALRAATNATAVTAAKSATSETPWVAEAMVQQGEALMELGRADEAVLVFERASAIPADRALLSRVAVQRADCLMAMGADDDRRYNQALEAYRAVLREEDISASMRLETSFKIGRTLEKLRRGDEAMDQYFANVVVAYHDATHPADGERIQYFDGSARAFLARAVFILADHYEGRGELDQAIRVLGHLEDAALPSSDEARRRIARLKERKVGSP